MDLDETVKEPAFGDDYGGFGGGVKDPDTQFDEPLRMNVDTFGS